MKRRTLRRRYGHAGPERYTAEWYETQRRTGARIRGGLADYEVTVERTVLIRGRTKPDTYEAVVTVYNVKSPAAARKAVAGKVVNVRRLP